MSHLPIAIGLLLAAQPAPRFEASVEMVYVTLSVQGKRGQPVAGLTADDLVVKEDGKPRPVSLLVAASDETGDEPARVDGCVLVDTSGSMATMTRRLTTAALDALAKLPKLRHRCLLSFDNDVRVWRADADPASLAADMVKARADNGATALNTALATAVDQLGEGRSRAVMLLVSDGDDVGSRVSQPEAIAAVQSSRFVIYPITHASPVTLSITPGVRGGSSVSAGSTGANTFGAGPRFSGPAYLSRLAELTGGRVFGPSDGDVEAVVQRIAAEIASQYVVGFTPASGYPGVHKLKIETRRKDVKIRSRSSFVMRGPDVH